MSHHKMGKTEETYVIAKYDYAAQGSQELDIKKGERLILLDDSKHWWKVQNAKHQSGFVPSNYVKREKPSIFDSIRRKVKKKTEAKMSPTASPIATKEVNVDSPRNTSDKTSTYTGTSAIVKYNYEAQQPDEVSLSKGARVLVMEKSNDGWWKGECDGVIGWFPSNYVLEEADDANDSSHNYTPAGSANNTLQSGGCLDVVLALYSFTSQNEEELSFQRGEHLEIIDRPENDPDWWKARNQKNEVGLVPKNYVQVVCHGNSVETYPGKNFPLSSSADILMDNGIPRKETTSLSLGASGGSPALFRNKFGSLQERPDLTGKSWYYGSITRSDCDQMLNEYAEDGDFIVRDSETNVGDYSISLKAPARNKHFRVHVEGRVFCIGQRRFDTLDDLVEHYKRAPIYTSPRGDKLYLIKPFQKTAKS
ncbi:cytoplasmic protein NCK2-like [Argiope bruennichi]|uniref:cytoplasmic protein NCK2-like n=1 Tax=Argiope bruennichi TaxID=94029 RepID=UPI0024941FA2|nr:cytoplasmic protein NCK2-like [Argiope bruennichi]